VRVNSVGWTIAGNVQTGITSLTTDDSLPDSQTQLQSTPAWLALKARMTGRPHRPHNRTAKYQAGTYYSEPSFCGCP
jgi:hypothetical protein